MAKRSSFKALKKSKSSEEFYGFCKTLAEEYAGSDYEFARKHFCQKYEITQNCYYKVLEEAVVKDLIDDMTIMCIMRKSSHNQDLYFEGSGGISMAKYIRLYDERCRYIANILPTETLEEIAKDFASGKKKTGIYWLSVKYEIPQKAIEYALYTAIGESVLDQETEQKVSDRLLKLAIKKEKDFEKRFLD